MAYAEEAWAEYVFWVIDGADQDVKIPESIKRYFGEADDAGAQWEHQIMAALAFE